MKYNLFEVPFSVPETTRRLLSIPSLRLQALGLILFLLMTLASPVGADPLLPANGGYTGLLDMPSARLIPDWNVRAYLTRADPYTTYGVTVGVMPWLEVNGRLIKISGLPTGLGSAYGDYKDKAIDVKLKLYDETEIWPALALGATDIHGTGLFTSRYVVATKYLRPFDITLGLGQGILAGEITRGPGTGQGSQDAALDFLTSSPSRDTGIFGGVEMLVTERLSLLAEHSSFDYAKLHGVDRVSTPGDSPWNFGLRYQPWKGGLVSLSYLRGEYIGWAYSQNFAFGPEGMLPWRQRPFWVAGEDFREWARQASNQEIAGVIRQEIAGEGFSSVRASVSDRSVWLEIENPLYLSNYKALGRAARAVVSFMPERIEWLYISLKSRDLIMITVQMKREDFAAFLDNRLDGEALLEASTFETDGREIRRAFLLEEPNATPLTEVGGSRRLAYGIKPSWQTLLNDPSGFLKNKFSLYLHSSYYPWPGGHFRAAYRVPLYNDISSGARVNEQEAVRTDLINFTSQSNSRVEVLGYDQAFDLPYGMLGRVGAGLFESAYGGFGAELFRFFGEGRWGAGLESELVWKRDVEQDFAFADSDSRKTAFLNLYYKLFPEYGVDAGLKIGRFLAGDRGVRLDMSRTFRHFTLGAWYTYTDTDIFTSPINQGYRDKGIYLVIPLSIFRDREVPTKLAYSLRPWTRDPGQTVSQTGALYPMADRGNVDTFKRHVEEMKE